MDFVIRPKERFVLLASFLLTVMLAVTPINNVFAEETSSMDIAALNYRAQVYVSELAVNGKTFQAGDTVSGTVTFYNSSPFDIFDLKYEIRLVSGIKTGKYRIYDRALGGENIQIKVGESKTVPFSYTLPERFGGADIGLFVQSQLADGTDLGWKTSEIFDVTGGVPYLNVVGSAVSIKDASLKDGFKNYGANEGPTIYKDKEPREAFISFQLSNPSKEEISVTPVLEISKYHSINTTPLFRSEIKDKKISVAAEKEGQRIDLPLPNFNWTPGVYVGTVSFVDDVGVRAERINFRYIVGGEIFNVGPFTSDKSSVAKGESIHIKMGYIGTPFDLNTTEHPTSQIAAVLTTIFDQADRVVATHTEEMDFLGMGMKEFDLKADRDALALRAEVLIKKGESEIAKYSFPLNTDYDAIKANYKPSWFEGDVSTLLVVALLGILVIVGAFIVVKRRMNPIIRRKRR